MEDKRVGEPIGEPVPLHHTHTIESYFLLATFRPRIFDRQLVRQTRTPAPFRSRFVRSSLLSYSLVESIPVHPSHVVVVFRLVYAYSSFINCCPLRAVADSVTSYGHSIHISWLLSFWPLPFELRTDPQQIGSESYGPSNERRSYYIVGRRKSL
jgi:hypothetical protein